MRSAPETLDHGLARGLVAFRWMALGWAGVGVVLQRSEVVRWWPAVALLGAAALVSVAATNEARTKPLSAGSPLILAEITVATGLLLFEGFVFEATRDQSLAWAWPAAGIIAVSVAAGVWWGMAAAAWLSAASIAGESWLRDELQWSTSTASKAALLVLAALAAAVVADVMRRAADEISTARAREEMARVLHDGVLQTLAVIQRRSGDGELVALARDQERDLRAHLFGAPSAGAGLAGERLSVQLRAAVDMVARRHEIEIGAVLAADLPDRPPEVAAALAGAAAEALTNAAKHAHADRISLYAEPDDDVGVVCTVHDNGGGFDVDAPRTGAGIAGSIEARLREVGGRVAITSAPGRGTDVRLWIP
ncbi:MAG: ATP-binding protein [Actinomycetota bacterium]